MDQLTNNPLLKYYRAPGIMVRLPSGGRFQSPGNVTTAPNGEVAVLPMRGADEMLMKSPEALMSGHAIEQTIKSCVPGILNPNELPAPDVDALLLAIRSATYGDQMDIECECPKCKQNNGFGFSISGILDTAQPLETEYPVRLSDDIIVYVKPFNLVASTKISLTAFQETRKMQILDQTGASEEERTQAIKESIDAITKMNTKALSDSVEKVVVPEGTVYDPRMIHGFIDNISKDMLNKIEVALKAVNEAGVKKEQHVICAGCGHEFTTNVEFDPATFFG
jgi:hypothetical protein